MEVVGYNFLPMFSEGSISEKYRKGIRNVRIFLGVGFRVISNAILFSPEIGTSDSCNFKGIRGTNLLAI